MGIEQFRNFMTHNISVTPWTGSDAYGDPTYGTAVSYRGRIAGKVQKMTDFLGQETVSKHTVYLGSAPRIQPKDKVTLSTGYVNSTEAALVTPPLLSVGRYADETGEFYTALYLG